MEVKASDEYTLLHANSVDKTTRYYLLQSSTAEAPPKPTDGAAIGSGWSETEPDDPSDPDMTLYFVDQTIMSDGSIKYSEVSKSSSYEAATKANAAAKKAQKDASDAAKTATNYIGAGADGLTVGNLTEDELKQNVHISNDSVNIRNGSTVLASFAENLIELGKESPNAIISLLNGMVRIMSENKENEDTGTVDISTDFLAKRSLGIDVVDNDTEAITGIGMFRSDASDLSTVNMHVSDKNGASHVYTQGVGVSIDSTEPTTGYYASTDIISTPSARYIDNKIVGISGTYIRQQGSALQFARGKNNKDVTASIAIPNDDIWDLKAIYSGCTPVLASGSFQMIASDTVTLSMPVSVQPHGVVLEFSPYQNGSAQSWGKSFIFIPKASADGGSKSFLMPRWTFSDIAAKVIYVHDTKLVGHADNSKNGTRNGITYNNTTCVLTKVYGV